MTDTEPDTGAETVHVERRQLRGIYRAVLAVLVLVLVVVGPVAVSQVTQQHTNDRLKAQNAQLEAQAARLDRVIARNAEADRADVAQACVNQHAGQRRFRAFMEQVRQVVQVTDPDGFDRLLAEYPTPTCDLDAARAELEAIHGP